MERRRAAGALLALAVCIACANAAPTSNDDTALDTYEEGKPEGCYYNFQHYGEGDRIMTNEPCLNCTCHNRMLMCYLRVCPFTKPIGQDCTIEKRADQCCPIITCPDVPVDLLTSTSTTSPAEYGITGVGHLDKYGCSIHGKYYAEGSKVPPTPNKPCEHCYCIRNMTTCVMQECTLHVDGCTPIYHKDVCCPVRYSCDHDEDMPLMLDDKTTTVGTTPGFVWTTTLAPAVTQDCIHGDETFSDGALIKTEKACEHCYCMKGDIVCVVQECGTPMENEGKNCTSLSPREGQCCPDTYICEGDNEITTDESATKPPRRFGEEGYRKDSDEQVSDKPVFIPELEGSGDIEGQTTEEPKVESDNQTPTTLITKDKETFETYTPLPDITLHTTSSGPSDDKLTGSTPVAVEQDKVTSMEGDKSTYLPDKSHKTTPKYDESFTSASEEPITHTYPPVMDQDKDITSQTISEPTTEEPFKSTKSSLESIQHGHDTTSLPEKEEPIAPTTQIDIDNNKLEHSSLPHSQSTTTIVDKHDVDSYTTPITDHTIEYATSEIIGEDNKDQHLVSEDHEIRPTLSSEKEIEEEFTEKPNDKLTKSPENDDVKYTLATTFLPDDSGPSQKVTHSLESKDKYATDESLVTSDITTPSDYITISDIDRENDKITSTEKPGTVEATSEVSPHDKDKVSTRVTEQEESTISSAIEKSTSSIPTHDDESSVKPVTSSEKDDLIPAQATTSHDQTLESETSTASELQDKYDQSTATGSLHVEDSSLKPTDLTEKDEIVTVEPTTNKYFEHDQTTIQHKLDTSDATTKDQIEVSTSVITDQEDKVIGDKTTVTVEKDYTTPEIIIDIDLSSQSTPHPFKETPDDHTIPIIGDDGELFEKTSTHPDKHYDLTTLAPTHENEVGDDTEMPGKVKPDIDIEKDIFTTPADIDDIATIEPDTTNEYDDKKIPSITVTEEPITKKDDSDSVTKYETVTYKPTVHEGTEKYNVPTTPKDTIVDSYSTTKAEPAIQQEITHTLDSETKSTVGLLEPVTNVPDLKKDDIHTTLQQIDVVTSTKLPLVELDSTKYVSQETSEPSQDFETNAAESPTTEMHTEAQISSIADITTKQPQANQIDNEIIHEFIPTISPSGVIPGEGSCLVEGVTYGNNSIVPSINKCQTACKCMSSIVKCDPIHCSPPPENMINCQPVYDAAESCCPTYVCDQHKVTTPPQPHSQMAITEPTVETECGENCHKEVAAGTKITCNDTQCVVKEEHIIPVKQPDLCTTDKCVLDSNVLTTQQSDQKETTSDVSCTGTSCNTEQQPESHVVSGDVTSEMPCTEESCGVDHKVHDCGPDGCKPSQEICSKVNGCESVQADSHTKVPCTGKSCTTDHKLPEHEVPEASLGGDCTGESGCKMTTATDDIMDQKLTTENVALIDKTSIKPAPEDASEDDLYGVTVTSATFAVDIDKETTVVSDDIKHEKPKDHTEIAQTTSIAPIMSTVSDFDDISSTKSEDQITYVTEVNIKEHSPSGETVSQSSQVPSEKVTESPQSTLGLTLDSKATDLPHVDEYTQTPLPDKSTEVIHGLQTTYIDEESTEGPLVSKTGDDFSHSTSAEISPEQSTEYSIKETSVTTTTPDIVREQKPTTEIPSESDVTEPHQTSDQVPGGGVEITTHVSHEGQYTASSTEKEISETTSHKIEDNITTPSSSQTLSSQISDSETTQYLITTEKQRIDDITVTTNIPVSTSPIVYEESATSKPIHEISTEMYGETSTLYSVELEKHTDMTIGEVTETPKVEQSISPTISSDEKKSSDTVDDMTNKPTEGSQSDVTKSDHQTETYYVHTSTETIDSDQLSTVSQATSDIIHVIRDKDDKLNTVIPVYDSKKDTTEDQTIHIQTPVIEIESTSKYTPELHTEKQKPSSEETTSSKYNEDHDHITESISNTPDILVTDVTEKPEIIPEDKRTTIATDISKEENSLSISSKTPDIDYHSTTDKYPEEYDKHTTEIVTEDKKTTNAADISKDEDNLTEGTKTHDIDYHSTSPADKYPEEYDKHTTEFVTEDKKTTNVPDISKDEDSLTKGTKTPDIDYHSTTPADKYPEEYDKHTTEFVAEDKKTTHVADVSKDEDSLTKGTKTPDIDYHSTTPADKYPEEYDKHATEFVTEDKKTTNVADISKDEDSLTKGTKTPDIDYHSTTPADKYPEEYDKHTTEFVTEDKKTTNVADISKDEDSLTKGTKTPDIDYHSTTPADKYPEEYDKHTTEFFTEDKKTTNVADISKEEDSLTKGTKTPDIDYHSTTPADKYPEEYDKHTTEFVTEGKKTTNVADISKDEDSLTKGTKTPDIDYHSTTPADKYPEEYDKHTTDFVTEDKKTTNVADVSKDEDSLTKGTKTPDIDYHSTTPADKYPEEYDKHTTEFVTEDKKTTNVADISKDEDSLTKGTKTPDIDYHSTTPADKYPEEYDKHTTEFVTEDKKTTNVADISKEEDSLTKGTKTPDIDYHSTTPADKYPEGYDKHTTEFVTEDKKTTNVADISKEEDSLTKGTKTPDIDYHSTTPADKYPEEYDKHTTEFVTEDKKTTNVADISKEEDSLTVSSKTPDIDYHTTTSADKYPEEYDKHTTEFVTEDKKTTSVPDISKDDDSLTKGTKKPDIDYHSTTPADKYPVQYDKHTTEFVTEDKETTNVADISKDEDRLTISSKRPDTDYHSTTPADKYLEEYDKHTTEVQSSTQKQELYSPVDSNAMEPQSTTLKESGEKYDHTTSIHVDLPQSSEQTTEYKVSEDYTTTRIRDTEIGVESYDSTTKGLESDTTHDIYTESPVVSKTQPTPEIEITTLSSIDKEPAVSDGVSTKSDFEEHTSVPESILTKDTEIPHEQTVAPLESTTINPAHVTSHVMSTVEDIIQETIDHHVDLDQSQISKSTPKDIEKDVTTTASYDHETVHVSQEELTTASLGIVTTHKPLIEKETDLKDITTIKSVTVEGHVEDHTHIPDDGEHVDVTPIISTDHEESPVPTKYEVPISVTEKQTTDQLTETPGSIIDLESSEIPKITTISSEEELLKHSTTVASPIVHDKEHESTEQPQSATELSTPDHIKPVQSVTTTIQPDKPSITDKPVPDDLSQPDDVTEHPSSEQIPPGGAGPSGYGQEPDYDEDEQPFGPGTCRYGGKVYVSAQQIPRDDPCDFCFCFRSDIICLQQSCPPPIHGCHEEPIQGFCCPRYECPVSMGTSVNMTTTTTTTTTTLPPHFLPHAYKGAAQRKGCQIKGHSYDVGEVVRASSGPCLHCTCGGDGQMKCDPKVCTPEPMLRQMIAAAVSSKRRR